MDPIANFLTQIRNAYKAHHETLSAPYSKIKEQIASLLKDAGFISDAKVEGQVPNKKLFLTLVYQGKQAVLTHLSRISTPSVRVYSPSALLRSPLSGRGLKIISTSKGLMTDRQAKKAGLGGEVICQIW